MLSTVIKRIFGSRNDRVLRAMGRVVKQINALEPEMQALSDAQLRAKTAEFRLRLQQGATLDDLLPEAFATVREASKRTLGMRHFDVQLIGGMVLHHGRIAEMRTGEGKTLVATLAAYLNALPEQGVHIITINDYLARRDAEWMGPVYEFLGLTIDVVIAGMMSTEKRDAYAADIIYGTNNEVGFDYLRDNMCMSLQERVQRGHIFAIVDEVDSILVDEARTPLIISGPSEESSQRYQQFNELAPKLIKQTEPDGPGDFSLDEKSRQAYLTEAGHAHVEELLLEQGILAPGESLYASHNILLMHYLNSALRAHYLFHRDVDYITKDDEVVIVDEHTGRTMPGRRWSDGLHQALEAKEGVKILPENQTLASITFQNYFRLYKKLSGMTGTADTEAYEFQQIYGLEVSVIPPNQPVNRIDLADQIYLTKDDKFAAIIESIKDTRERGQPMLVGTASIETSEYLSDLLNKINVPHQVLNAKFHEQEAHIIAEAGRPGTVTIATNMAGRGTDIVLGGNLQAEIVHLKAQGDVTSDALDHAKADWQQRHDAVVNAGGLYIIGTERHESRRIDNQLRGRAGRQGDPGGSRFFLSLEDNLIRIFASDRVAMLMRKLGMKENEPIEHPLVTRAIENAQRKVEGHNFDIRKQLLEYDNVANEQRQVIYRQRNELLEQVDISETIEALRQDVVSNIVDRYIPPQSFPEQWDLPGLELALRDDFNCELPIEAWFEKEEELQQEQVKERIDEALKQQYLTKEALIGADAMRQFEKTVMLQSLDMHWREHLAAMDHLRQGIHLRGYAQKNPKQEYKREAFKLFSELIDRIKYHVISYLSCVVLQTQEAVQQAEQERLEAVPKNIHYLHDAPTELEALDDDVAVAEEVRGINPADRQSLPKVGRNDPCPCGSGRKYKQCHGEL